MSFFPRDDTPNIDSTVPVRFSNDLREDLYQNTLQHGPQPIPQKYTSSTNGGGGGGSGLYLNYGEHQPQTVYAPLQPQQHQTQPPAPVFHGGFQVSQPPSTAFQRPQQQQQQQYFAAPSSIGPPIQQYAPQFVQGGYGFATPPQMPIRRPPPPPQIPPIYQQQQYPRPGPPPSQYSTPNGYLPPSGEDNSILGALSNFVTNVGQGAAGLFNNQNVNLPSGPGYRPQSQYLPQPNAPFQQRPGLNGAGPIGQLARAVEEITRNDDYQCIPKVICQMVGNQRRLPPIFGSPIFSA